MQNPACSDVVATVDLGGTISVKVPRELTDEEAVKLGEYLKSEIADAAERWVEAEMEEDGCWCYGFDHNPKCKHWVLPR